MNAEEAYIESIKSIGNFKEDPINNIFLEFSIKPSIPDIILLNSTILSILGFLLIFMNNIIATVITFISTILYSGASYYLYSYSQYVRKDN